MIETVLNNILPIIIGTISAPVGAWIGSRLEKRKHEVEIGSLRAEMDKRLSEVRKNELDNVREANDILMNSVVIPLKKEITTLRYGLNRLNRALEKIPSCPYAATCPITHELQELSDDDKCVRDASDRERGKGKTIDVGI